MSSETPAVYDRRRDVAIQAALEAGRLIRQHAGRIPEHDIRDKGIHDVVTEVDEASQRLIVKMLKERFPDDAVLAEEETEGTSAKQHHGGYRWIVDPIDGTTNFTRGIPPYAVSIGVQEDDRMVVGVVFDVSRNELFTAVRGGGFYVNGVHTRVSTVSTVGESVLTTGFPYRSFDHVEAYLEVMRSVMQSARALRRPGSASVDLAYVAAGRFDGFFEIGLMPWDVAAGVLLIEEAGGRVSDFSDRDDTLFSGQLLASNGILHSELLTLAHPLVSFSMSR